VHRIKNINTQNRSLMASSTSRGGADLYSLVHDEQQQEEYILPLKLKRRRSRSYKTKHNTI